jgi:hypothetical protein
VGRPSEKARFTKRLTELWRDLQDDQYWKYEASSPVQILEKLKLDRCQQNNDELARLIGSGIAGRAYFAQPPILLGFWQLSDCHSGCS